MHKYTNTNTQVQKISAGEYICVHVSGEGLKYWPHIVWANILNIFQSIKKNGKHSIFPSEIIKCAKLSICEDKKDPLTNIKREMGKRKLNQTSDNTDSVHSITSIIYS